MACTFSLPKFDKSKNDNNLPPLPQPLSRVEDKLDDRNEDFGEAGHVINGIRAWNPDF